RNADQYGGDTDPVQPVRTDAGFQIRTAVACRRNCASPRRDIRRAPPRFRRGRERRRNLCPWRCFSRNSGGQVQCLLDAKHPRREFTHKPPKFLQFAARRIHRTSGKLISEALSAKLVWLSRTIKGT